MLRKPKYLVLAILVMFVFTVAIAAFAASSDIVYITKTGKKYHASSCGYLSKSKIQTTRGTAEKSGYTACSVCRP